MNFCFNVDKLKALLAGTSQAALSQDGGHRLFESGFYRGVTSGILETLQLLGASKFLAECILRDLLPADVDPYCLPNDYTMQRKTGPFKVHEHFNGYELENVVTGERHWLSDGVNCVPLNDRGDYLAPGSPGFIEAWEDQFNSDEDTTLAAYFTTVVNVIDSHSVNCFICHELVDERECVPGPDGEGEICPRCQAAGHGKDPHDNDDL